MSHRVAIVGNKGFIGSALSEHISRSGHAVIGFNSAFPPVTSVGTLPSAITDVDSIVWAASKVNPASASINPKLVSLELQLWERFLDLWSNRSIQKQTPIIFISSGGCVYSSGSSPFREDDPSEGINEYGRLKVQMERMLQSSDLPHTIVRAANIYGPNQPSGRGQGVIAEWLSALRSGKKPKVYGALDSERDYLYVSDLCSAIEKTLKSPSSLTLNVGSGVGTTLQSLLNIFAAELEYVFEVETIEARGVDRNSYWLDISKTKQTLNWEPSISIAAGIKYCLANDDSQRD